MIHLHKAYLNTTQEIDTLNATHDLKRALRDSQIVDGVVVVFLPAGGAGVLILENNQSIRDGIKKMILSLVSREEAPLISAFCPPSVTIPLKEGKLMMGAWQEVWVFDFEKKTGRREVLIQVMGEGAPKKQAN